MRERQIAGTALTGNSVIVLLSLTLLLFAALLAGCASNSNESNTGQMLTDATEEELDEDAFSSSEFSTLNGLYKLSSNGEYAYPIEKVDQLAWADSVEGYSDKYRYRLFSAFEPYSELMTIDRSSGEGLVVMGEAAKYVSTGEKVELVVDYGYWSGEEVGNRYGCYLDELNGESIEEIRGNSKEINEVLDGTGIRYLTVDEIGLLTSQDCDETIDWGQYQGTQFVEGSMVCDTRYYLGRYDGNALNPSHDSPDYPTWVEVDKTKDGYFVFNVSELPAGVYYTDLTVEGHRYVFELV